MGALSAVAGIWVVLDIVLVFFLQWEHKPKPTFSFYSLYKATEAYLSIAEAEKKMLFQAYAFILFSLSSEIFIHCLATALAGCSPLYLCA